EFEATPDKVSYAPENWNASVLWNFLAEAINNSLNTEVKDKFSKECIEAVGDRIAKYYKDIDGIEDLVKKAVNDIKEYAEALGLYEYLRESCKNKTGFYSNIQTIKTDDCVTKIKITNAMIKVNDRNKQTEITVVYKDNNTLAYKVFDNRYVTLNQDMSINTEIKGTDPIYIYINDGSEEQDREYLKSRQSIVAVLEALRAAPKMKTYIAKIARSNNKTTETNWRTCKAIYENFDNKGNKDDVEYIKKIETRMIHDNAQIKYDDISNREYSESGKWTHRESIADKEQIELKWFGNITKAKSTQSILDYILTTIYNENKTGLINDVFTYSKVRLIRSTYKGKTTENRNDERLTSFKMFNIDKDINAYLNDNTLHKEIRNGAEPTNVFNRFSGYSDRGIPTRIELCTYIEKYPEVLIVEILTAKGELNKVTCNSELTIREVTGDITRYRLESVVSEDTKTGDVYVAYNYEDDDTSYHFKEYSSDIVMKVAIYEKVTE
ncbi:MAG: hypothetical protein IJS10_02600, partial [Alphaproteobacteria bacterium]|nr:hypothetical protein [Alphaproteobacteria bacterium]